MSSPFELEVCVDRLDAALLAVDAGATRIEFNQALELDGLTPSLGSCRRLIEFCRQPIVVMNRPHDRGFVYSKHEKLAMLDDCRWAMDVGVAGIVIGALTDLRQLDLEFLTQVRSICSGVELIMHRAFDELDDLPQGLEQLIDLGFERVLTSGGAAKAIDGSQSLRQLMQQSVGRLQILPGGGVSSSNALDLLRQTGCNQLHGSFKIKNAGRLGPDPLEIQAVRRLLEARVRSEE